MSSGLLAIIDDITALVKVSAASLDDIPAQVAKTTGKVSGIVIDDAAVTPKYVVGLDPSRELSVIYHIAKRSIINKILILAPASLLLGHFTPWAIQPLLMLGGSYLCLEGYEKIHALFAPHATPDTEIASPTITLQQLETMRIKSAVQTDFILSAEIIAITYSAVAEKDFVTQSIVLFCIALGITTAVYGVVGIIVKADDVGLHMAKKGRYRFTQKTGRAIVKCMPPFLVILGYVGTAAMLWVGAEIIVHGIPFLHHNSEKIQHHFSEMPAIAWLSQALVCAAGGLIFGAIVAKALSIYNHLRRRIS